MTRIDQFESTFRAATRIRFEYSPQCLSRILVVTDLDDYQATQLTQRLRQLYDHLGLGEAAFTTTTDDHSRSIRALLQTIEEVRPELIVTYRNLYSGDERWPSSLGTHLDVLTQATETPVLVLPRPEHAVWSGTLDGANEVLAITDHLVGDAHLVSVAAHFTRPDGKLVLAHVEDSASFARYLDAVSKVPTIDTDRFREEIGRQLLKDPSDYIDSCREGLKAAGVPLEVVADVRHGDHIDDFLEIIETHGIDLVVLNTKDEDQLAMHGLAYPLAVELDGVPMLML